MTKVGQHLLAWLHCMRCLAASHCAEHRSYLGRWLLGCATHLSHISPFPALPQAREQPARS